MPTELGPSGPSPEIRPSRAPSRSGKAPRAMSRSRIALAVVTLGAFAAFIWYAYGRVGEPGGDAVAPLIKADEGPTRVRPESPGGMEIPHQDKMIYEELSGAEPEPGVERLLPPPEVPLPPPATTAAISPGAGPGPAEVETLVSPAAPPPPPPEAQAEPAPAPTPPQPEKTAAVEPGLAPAAGPGAPKAAPAGAEDDAVTAQAGPDEAAPAAPEPSAKPRPGEPEEPAVAALPSPPGDQVPAAVGGHRIQLAAVRSREGAEREWQRLKTAHADLLGPLTLTVEKVDLGSKGIFYRVQGGPLTQQAAAEACAELKRRKAGCYVVGP